MNLPKHINIKYLSGMDKNQLFNALIYAIYNYKLKSAIEATTYIFYAGYIKEWWDIVFDILLKNIHINAYGHFQTILDYYNNITDTDTGLNMCIITTILTTLDKNPIITQQQLKSLPFFDFALKNGSTKLPKLRIIEENIKNCIEDAIHCTELNELINLTHYILREDYGHNKYIPIYINKIINNSPSKKTELNALIDLYGIIKGNKKYLCVIVIMLIYFHDIPVETELGRYAQQAEYYYDKTISRIYKKQNTVNKKQIFKTKHVTHKTIEETKQNKTIEETKHGTHKTIEETKQNKTIEETKHGTHKTIVETKHGTHKTNETIKFEPNDLNFIFEPIENTDEPIENTDKPIKNTDEPIFEPNQLGLGQSIERHIEHPIENANGKNNKIKIIQL